MNAPAAFTQPDSEQRAHNIAFSRQPYRVIAEIRPGRPEVDVYTRAPTVAEAERLADASIAAGRRRLDTLSTDAGLDLSHQLTVTQLGPSAGVPLATGAAMLIGLLTFFVTFAVALGVWLVVHRARLGWTAAERGTAAAPPRPATALQPAAAPAFPQPFRVSRQAPAQRPAMVRAAERLGDWPRTTRVLPWMIAGFIVMLWLVPFNSVQLAVSTPIDMHLDRLALCSSSGSGCWRWPSADAARRACA